MKNILYSSIEKEYSAHLKNIFDEYSRQSVELSSMRNEILSLKQSIQPEVVLDKLDITYRELCANYEESKGQILQLSQKNSENDTKYEKFTNEIGQLKELVINLSKESNLSNTDQVCKIIKENDTKYEKLKEENSKQIDYITNILNQKNNEKEQNFYILKEITDNICKISESIKYLSQREDFNQSSQKISDNMEKIHLQLTNHINHRMDSVRDITENINVTTQQLSSKLLSQVPHERGKEAEKTVAHIIEQSFPSFQIDHVGNSPHTADIIVRDKNIKIMIEVKSYISGNVPTSELDKFYSDLDISKPNGAIMLSMHSGIVGHENFEISTYKFDTEDCVICYLHNVNYTESTIILAIQALISMIKSKHNSQLPVLKSIELQSDDKNLDKILEKVKELKNTNEMIAEKNKAYSQQQREIIEKIYKMGSDNQRNDIYLMENISELTDEIYSDMYDDFHPQNNYDKLLTQKEIMELATTAILKKIFDALYKELDNLNISFVKIQESYALYSAIEEKIVAEVEIQKKQIKLKNKRSIITIGNGENIKDDIIYFLNAICNIRK